MTAPAAEAEAPPRDAPKGSADAEAGLDAGAAHALAKRTADATFAHHSKSFSLAATILPPARRDDAAVVYTYCRRVDDAVDEAASADDARAAIATLRAELDALYGGAALADPVLARMAQIARARRVPRHYPAELIAGMEMDALGARYRTVDDLLTYAYRVAGVVGLMMCHVLGVRDDRALVPATHLGLAMQLTNICRDVAEDWGRGRLYLPDELLVGPAARALGERAAAGEPLPRDAAPALAAATRELLALADRYYRSAERGLPQLDWRSAFGVRAARHLYAAIGDRVAARGCDPLAPRAVVPRWKKFALLGLAAAGALREAPGRLIARGSRSPPTTTLELSDVDRL
ncbi:MAG: phytoene/squalene synthase family protein [Kofleriaceae bacterium]